MHFQNDVSAKVRRVRLLYDQLLPSLNNEQGFLFVMMTIYLSIPKTEYPTGLAAQCGAQLGDGAGQGRKYIYSRTRSAWIGFTEACWTQNSDIRRARLTGARRTGESGRRRGARQAGAERCRTEARPTRGATFRQWHNESCSTSLTPETTVLETLCKTDQRTRRAADERLTSDWRAVDERLTSGWQEVCTAIVLR